MEEETKGCGTGGRSRELFGGDDLSHDLWELRTCFLVVVGVELGMCNGWKVYEEEEREKKVKEMECHGFVGEERKKERSEWKVFFC